MSGQRYETYDFRARTGYTDPSSIALDRWLKKTASVFSKHWRDISSVGINVTVKSVTTRTFESAIENPTAPTLGCIVKVGALKPAGNVACDSS